MRIGASISVTTRERGPLASVTGWASGRVRSGLVCLSMERVLRRVARPGQAPEERPPPQPRARARVVSQMCSHHTRERDSPYSPISQRGGAARTRVARLPWNFPNTAALEYNILVAAEWTGRARE